MSNVQSIGKKKPMEIWKAHEDTPSLWTLFHTQMEKESDSELKALKDWMEKSFTNFAWVIR